MIEPLEPDIGEDDITGTYEIVISEGCGTDVSTYRYVTSKGGGRVIQQGVVEVSGVIPAYTPLPRDNQADIFVELTPKTSCGQTGAIIISNVVKPANNPTVDPIPEPTE